MTKYHFIGIGGIGMSALAKLALENGDEVTGSDPGIYPQMKEALSKLGAQIYSSHDPSHVSRFSQIVYSTSIKESNVELQVANKLSLPILHRSDLLHHMMEDKKGILVAGAHGKTSTSAMLATLLEKGGLDPSYAIGGLLIENLANAKRGKGEYFLAEADESDGSFLKLEGACAIVTNVEADHLDYWGSLSALENAYKEFIAKIKNPSLLFLCNEDPFLKGLKEDAIYYGFDETSDLMLFDFEAKESGSYFKIKFNNQSFGPFFCPLRGRHYALNASAAIGCALSLGVSESSIQKSLSSFSGVKRRLELIGSHSDILVFDDYGHHPTEIKATISALKHSYSENRLVVIFQPHRYSRLLDLISEFASSFELADVLFLLDVYAASEQKIEGVDSDALFSKIALKNKIRTSTFTLVSDLCSFVRKGDLCLFIGAGDITKYPPIFLEDLKRLAWT